MSYIKKTDYIAIYGEEAYRKLAAKRSLSDKEYREAHKEEHAARTKKYQTEHREECSLYGKKYREDNKEQLKEKRKEYRKKNKESIATSQKLYREKNKKQLTEQFERYRKTKAYRASVLASSYRKADRESNRGEGDVTQQFILDNIFTSKCIYCGDSDWEHLGCDRVDNTQPHNIENVVCSCGLCNCEREIKKMSVEEFVVYRKTNPRECDKKRRA